MRVLLITLLLLPLGCARASPDVLMVATNWPEVACASIEQAIAGNPLRIRWLRVPPADDPTRSVDRQTDVDIVLGGPLESYARLAARNRLQPFMASDARPWRTVSRPSAKVHPTDRVRASTSSDWPAEYARSVLDAAEDRRPDVESGEGVGLVAGSRRAEQARALLAVLVEATPTLSTASLQLELLDSTLGVARPELRAARASLARKGDPAQPLAWMTEPPPWPPASITRMRTRPDGPALIALLAEQVAPDRSARDWLLRAFDRVPKPLDVEMLGELDEVARGKLASDPRFRAWLRSEWTAWARQRYRRVVRDPSQWRRSPS